MLGGGRSQYKVDLMKKYPNVLFIDHVNPPYHLHITSYARIGIVTYNTNSLNNIYCAPNKIWEYGGFGIPMLANDIPGLKDTVEKYGAGLCLDMDNPTAIIEAVGRIDSDYARYSRNAKDMFDGCDIGTIVEKILGKYKS